MINKNEFPILEFDNNKNAKITPQLLEERPYLGIEYGVICFDIKTKENFIKKKWKNSIRTEPILAEYINKKDFGRWAYG